MMNKKKREREPPCDNDIKRETFIYYVSYQLFEINKLCSPFIVVVVYATTTTTKIWRENCGRFFFFFFFN